MEEMRSYEKCKRKITYIVVAAMIFIVSRAVPVYAGDSTDAAALSINGEWSERYGLEEGTTDYYRFTIQKAGKIDLKMMAYAPDLVCTLYDGGLNGIKEKCANVGSETSPRTVTIEWWLPQGTFYVAVSSRVEKSGAYKLKADLRSSGITAADKDSYDHPQDMQVNGQVSGVLTYSNKDDWYRSRIASAGYYRCFSRWSGCNGATCFLYDQDLRELCAMRSDAPENAKEIMLAPGIYYMKIEGGEAGGTYSCGIKEIIPVQGDILTDDRGQVRYKVTKAGREGGTVTYQSSGAGGRASIVIPSTVRIDGITYKVTGIAANAYKGDSGIRKVTIGKNVTSIGANTFSKCANLKSVTIPANVKSIGKQAFYNCKSLKNVTIKTTKLTSSKVGANAFKGIHKKAVIKVPKSRVRAYKKILKKRGVVKGAVYKKLS